MFCPQCGRETLSDGLFCNYCGTRLPTPGRTSKEDVEDDKTVRVNTQPDAGKAENEVSSQPAQATTIQAQSPVEDAPAINATGPISTPSPQVTPASSQPLTSDTHPSHPSVPTMPGGFSGAYPPVPQAQPPLQGNPNYFQSGVQPALPPQMTSGANYAATPYPAQAGAPAQPRQPVIIVLPERPNWAQKLTIRLFQPYLANNAVFGIILGALVSTLLGMLCFFCIISLLSNAVPENISRQYYVASSDAHIANAGELTAGNLLQFLPLQSPFRDTAELFLISQNAQTTLQDTFPGGSSGTATTYTETMTSPFHGLLLLQALLLVLGGYIAASTDFRNTRGASLVRGMAIAIPYTVLLFLLATQVNGNIPLATSTSTTQQSTSTFSVDSTTLLLYGLLWGAVFGLVGAAIKLGQGQIRHHLHRYLYTQKHPQLTGIITGGLSALLLGLSLALIFGYSLYSQINHHALNSSIPDVILNPNTPADPNTGPLQAVAVFVQGLTRAVGLLAYACGIPLVVQHAKGQDGYFSVEPGSYQVGKQLGMGVLAHPWVFALLLVPIVALFLGGRASVAISRVRGVGPGAIQGALIALPFTALLLLLTAINTNSITQFSTANIANSGTISIGTQAGDVLLWGLVSGVFLGALGGAYQNSGLRSIISRVLGLLVKPIILLFTPLYIFFDLLLGRPRQVKRSSAYVLLYTALIVAIVLGILSLLVGLMLVQQAQTLTREQSENFRNVMTLLLIALPGILLVSSAAAALAHDPLLPYFASLQAQTGVPPQPPTTPPVEASQPLTETNIQGGNA
jgi:hypothetical protein